LSAFCAVCAPLADQLDDNFSQPIGKVIFRRS